MHFKSGELGATIADSDVPLQTKRLHPIIYGWQGHTAKSDEHSEKICSHPSPATDTSGPQEGQAPPKSVGTRDNVVEHRSETSASDVLFARPKKKIAPTLVTSLPAAESRHPAADTKLATKTLPESPRSPISSADDLQNERKKRRIAPTLVSGDATTACVQSADADRTRALPSLIDESAGIRDDALRNSGTLAEPTPGGGQERAPKKKRLTPTLVSAL